MTRDPAAEPSLAPISIPSAALTSDRFRTIRALGAGGMASVFEVVDQSTGKHVALKRLHVEPDRKRQRRALELFEREFYTLSQIAHPRIVTVYDYGVDAHGAYYTMELLDGGELNSLVPLAYPAVCRIGRDIASALSLLHSRRLVYRDLNPRNVHCTQLGAAKLIDFGATTAMGPSRQLVGTPGYCAPEMLDAQMLDARTDLFALGATLYFALTGRHAYPAKTFEQLRGMWDSMPRRPSELAPDVPYALDALIMDLLHVDPALRPANAAEVMDQLAAIEGTKVEEQLQVTQAYLVTPTLVGREAVMGRVRAKLLRSLRAQGSALVFTGVSGVGRTRLLGACALDAKILGALVARADAADAGEEYGVVRTLAQALLEAAPEQSLRCAEPSRALLGIVLPELLARPTPIERAHFDDPNLERVQLMAAWSAWFSALSDLRPIALAIDDLHRIDEPSATLLALLAHDVGKHRLTILGTRETQAMSRAPAALQLFESAATSLQLSNLSAPQVQELLGSVFGNVPHVQMLARQLHAIAAGNPRDTLQLAQSLVDRKLARYLSGAWSLPARFDDADLPSNMAQALRDQVEAMSGRARTLGRLISLIRDRSVTLDECAALYPQDGKQQVNEALDELCAAQIATRKPDGYELAHAGFHAALQAGLSDPERAALHRHAAELFARREDEGFRHVLHLLRAGDATACLDAFVPFAARSQELTDGSAHEYAKLIQSLPVDWFEVFTRAIDLCDQLGRPARDAIVLGERLMGLVNVMRVPIAQCTREVRRLQRTLTRASGLDDYAQLAAALPADVRLEKALELAQARYDASPEPQRTFPPQQAIGHLLRNNIAVIGLAAVSQDHALWATLPSLAPFAPLSAAVGYTELFAAGVGGRINGQHERSCRIYEQMLEGSRSGSSVGATNVRMVEYGIMAAQGMMEAGMGRRSSLRWAEAIADDSLFRVTELVIRMLYALWQGRVRDADQLKEQLELLRVQTSPRRMSEGIHLVGQASAHANSDDLTRLKHTIDEIRELAERHGGWVPVLDYASGEYQRIRGDLTQAVQHLEAALSGIRAGTHQIWPHAVGALTRVLWRQGKLSEASALGLTSLRAAEPAELGYLTSYIRMPLALALADSERVDEAVQYADEAIAQFEQLGSSGLNLVLAYETRAWVAIRANDRSSFERFARMCADECKNAGSRVLRAKYERLVRSASQVSGVASHQEVALSTMTGTQLTSMLVGCDRPRERAERCLALLLRRSGTRAGFLFLMGDHGPELVAQTGDDEPSPNVCAGVAELIDSELQARDVVTGSVEQEDSVQSSAVMVTENGTRHRLVLLSHQQPDGFAITGAAALRVEADSPFVHPGALAAHLSRLIFDAGDVTPVLGD